MLRSDLEDYRYNSQVALGNLEAVYMDVLKTTRRDVTIPIPLIPIPITPMPYWYYHIPNCRYCAPMVFK